MIFDEILLSHTPPIHDLAEQLRSIILNTVPGATEKAYPGWHGIGYTHPRVGYFCAIFPRKDTVSVGFEWGVLLPDPDRMLRGSGSQVRYMECAPDVQIPIDAIQQLLLACLELPDKRSEKLALVHSGARPV